MTTVVERAQQMCPDATLAGKPCSRVGAWQIGDFNWWGTDYCFQHATRRALASGDDVYDLRRRRPLQNVELPRRDRKPREVPLEGADALVAAFNDARTRKEFARARLAFFRQFQQVGNNPTVRAAEGHARLRVRRLP